MTTLALDAIGSYEVRSLDDLDRVLGAARASGFDAVSLGVHQFAGDIAGAAALLERHGLACNLLLALTVTGNDDKTMQGAHALAEASRVIDCAGVLALFWTRLTDESIDRLGRCADLLAAPLLLEFAPGGALETIDAADALVHTLGTDRARILIDAFHFERGPSTWDMLDTVPLDHVGGVQFTDGLPAVSDDYMAETMNRRAWPGEGELSLDRFASTLLARGYGGPVGVEVFSEESRKLSIEDYVALAHSSAAPYWR